MIRKTFIVFIAFMLSVSASQAQKNIREGFIVMLNGDTVKGFINNPEWRVNPERIQFRKSPGGDTRRYGPMDIRGFYVAKDNYYESFVVDVDKKPFRTSNLEYHSEPQWETETVFLQKLVSGKASLFYLMDKQMKEHFFLELDTGNIYELEYRKYLLKDQGGSTPYEKADLTRELKLYVGQLKYAFFQCSQMLPSIESASYTQKDLTRLVDRYNECATEQGSRYVKELETVKVYLGVTAGVSATFLKFTPRNYGTNTYLRIDYENVKFTGSFKPSIGISFDVNLMGGGRKWSIYNELSYYGYTSIADFDDDQGQDHTVHRNIKFDMSYIRLSPMLRYTFITENPLHPFINIGITAGYAISRSNTYKYDTFYGDEFMWSEEGDYNDRIQNLGIGGNAGAGLRYMCWSIEARYEVTSGNQNQNSMANMTQAVYLMVAYQFGRNKK